VTSASSLSITNVTVWDRDAFRDGPVCIEAGRVADIGPDVDVGDRVIDGGGGVVIPGLIDAHFHAFAVSLDLETMPSQMSYVALAAARRLRNALTRGFTTVRDVAGGDIGLRRAIEVGLIQAPRYFYSGPALSQTGGHGDPRSPDLLSSACATTHITEVVDGVEALRVAVRERARTGAHVIKILTSGGVVSPSDPLRLPQYSAEEVSVVTAEAERHGLYVAAHAYSPEAILHSVRNGVRTIEHGNLLDIESAREMAARGAFLVPTLAAYDAMNRRGAEIGLNPVAQGKNQEVLDSGVDAVRVAVSEGVKVGWGSDLMGALEIDQLRGLELQAQAMAPAELLRSVTVVNAEILGRPDLGVVEVGGPADLLILPRNPLEDPSTLWTEEPGRVVVAAGQVLT
jgi:imidazolonepropionase-like amidohydrolase